MSGPRIVSYIYSETNYGNGTPNSPLRGLRQLHTLDGVLVAQFDPLDENHIDWLDPWFDGTVGEPR